MHIKVFHIRKEMCCKYFSFFFQEEDKKRFAAINNQLSAQNNGTSAEPQHKAPCVLMQPLITTITYCALYHYDNKVSIGKR